MSKYKEENIIIKNVSQGWTKNRFEVKYYRKDNWMIAYYKNLSFSYFIIDESYEYGYYFTKNKQEFLEEKHMLKVRNTPVWKAMHGEYEKEET